MSCPNILTCDYACLRMGRCRYEDELKNQGTPDMAYDTTGEHTYIREVCMTDNVKLILDRHKGTTGPLKYLIRYMVEDSCGDITNHSMLAVCPNEEAGKLTFDACLMLLVAQGHCITKTVA